MLEPRQKDADVEGFADHLRLNGEALLGFLRLAPGLQYSGAVFRSSILTVAGFVKCGPAIAVVVLALALAGCGRRGDLEVPGATKANVKTVDTPNTGRAQTIDESTRSPTKAVAPQRDFLLDPLL